MANEIQYSAKLIATKSGATINLSSSGSITMSGDDMLQGTQLIGTSAEALSFGEITGAPAKLYIRNLDDTNFVEIASDSGITEFPQKLLAGEFCLLSPETGTIYAKADTASVRIAIGAVEA